MDERNIIGCGRVGILFVHGILGTPRHFDMLMPYVPPQWEVKNITLAGHGESERDFAKASMKEWKAQVRGAVDELAQKTDKLIIAAHSMGTLFALREAIDGEHAPKIAELFLLNVPLKVRITRGLFKLMRTVLRGKIKPGDEWAQAAISAYGIERDTNIFKYIGWLPRYIELFKEIRRTRKILKVSNLSVPITAYFSPRDEMVSPKSAKLFGTCGATEIKTLPSSGHFYYSRDDKKVIESDFKALVDRIK